MSLIKKSAQGYEQLALKRKHSPPPMDEFKADEREKAHDMGMWDIWIELKMEDNKTTEEADKKGLTSPLDN